MDSISLFGFLLFLGAFIAMFFIPTNPIMKIIFGVIIFIVFIYIYWGQGLFSNKNGGYKKNIKYY